MPHNPNIQTPGLGGNAPEIIVPPKPPLPTRPRREVPVTAQPVITEKQLEAVSPQVGDVASTAVENSVEISLPLRAK